ncbi:hypothetical protein BC777_1430 [Yoonia maricola]|uniref:Sulfotransferase family protein n=1 Tax=Yoonia maricola TaxID=420999 RepID=A0A2M8WNR9_9RHOB|nr:hypothetical protein [Yoonia maricola]PJI92575.1 hypothetical protein BC777_1430 [Yoonia maricola]
MRQIIVHIGHPKTGTSTLQKCLHRSRGALLQHGVLYPHTIRGNNHLAIKPLFVGPEAADRNELRRHKGNYDAIMEDAQNAWTLVCNDIARHKPETVILSSEGFFGLGKNDGVRKFVQELKAMADEVTFVAYIRAPSAFYLSSLSQNIKFSGSFRPHNRLNFFRSSLQHYLQLTNATTNVHKFDRAELIGGDIVQDFTTRYLTKTAASAVKMAESEANLSMSAEAMALLDDIDAGTAPKPYDQLRVLTKEQQRHILRIDRRLPGGTSPKYKPGVARIIHDATSDLEWVENTLDIRFERPEAHPSARFLRLDELTSVRAICLINEQRYQQLGDKALKGLARANQKDRVAAAIHPLIPKAVLRAANGFRNSFRAITRPIRHSGFARRIRNQVKLLKKRLFL